jgi:multisubunit Na+/H+ antiporter MnhB subunit
MYLSAALNAVALVALLASSDVLSGKSPHVHQAFVGSIGWFGIGVLFSGAAVIFYHFTRHYYGEGGGGDLVRVATPVASIMSFLLLIAIVLGLSVTAIIERQHKSRLCRIGCQRRRQGMKVGCGAGETR